MHLNDSFFEISILIGRGYIHRPVFGLVKLARCKLEKSFVRDLPKPRVDEGLCESLLDTSIKAEEKFLNMFLELFLLSKDQKMPTLIFDIMRLTMLSLR